jgi:alcohol dehydrogenase class IV
MADLVFHVPARVVFAPGAINRLGAVVRGYATRTLLVTESILYERDTIQRAQAALAASGVQAITFDEVVPNSTSVAVERAVALARASRIDAVVGMGGVRTLSCAKLVAAVCKGRQSVDDILSDGLDWTEAIPYVEVPSTCRNPFMLRDEAVVVDARDRHTMICEIQQGITREVVLDPLLALTIPAKYTAATMFDADRKSVV